MIGLEFHGFEVVDAALGTGFFIPGTWLIMLHDNVLFINSRLFMEVEIIDWLN